MCIALQCSTHSTALPHSVYTAHQTPDRSGYIPDADSARTHPHRHRHRQLYTPPLYEPRTLPANKRSCFAVRIPGFRGAGGPGAVTLAVPLSYPVLRSLHDNPAMPGGSMASEPESRCCIDRPSDASRRLYIPARPRDGALPCRVLSAASCLLIANAQLLLALQATTSSRIGHLTSQARRCSCLSLRVPYHSCNLMDYANGQTC